MVGGNSAMGIGRLIPKDGKARGLGEGWEVRFNPGTESYEYRRNEGGATPWREVNVGQRVGAEGRNYILTELNGVPQKENISSEEAFPDLEAQIHYQMATEGVRQHLQGLANQGSPVSEIDAQNLSLFFHPDFGKAMVSYDSGQPIRTQGGLMGGSSVVYALVDPATGRIHLLKWCRRGQWWCRLPWKG
jgi:hypothetical protein